MKVMKQIKILLGFVLLSLWSITAYSQTKIYTLSFNQTAFEFVDAENDMLKIIPSQKDYFYMGDASQPALPYISYNILIPPNTRIADFSVIISDNAIRDNVIIAPNPKAYHGESNDTATIGIPNYLPQMYPEKSVVLTAENIMKGYVFAGFVVSPFVYNAETNELRFVSEITITIQLEYLTGETSIIRKDAKEYIKSIVINPHEMDILYSTGEPIEGVEGEEGEEGEDADECATGTEYLVITTNALKASFNPLIAWKIQKGVRSKIITVEEIYANYSGATPQLQIKNCLKDYYDNHCLKWVLLGGDNTIVPVQACYGYTPDVTPPTTDNTIPCDLFYACFDKTFDWNANGNNEIGETSDNIDMSPEVYISRVPVRIAAHVTAFVNKLLKYEKNPATSNYVEKILLAGSILSNYLPPNGYSDAHLKSEKIYNDHIAPYWNTNGIVRHRFYDTDTDFPGGATYDLNATNLQAKINDGYHFIHTAGHGSAILWKLEVGNYLNTQASALQNVNASIILTAACNSNNFDQNEPCLSEAFIRNPNGACVAFWGSSRFGIYRGDGNLEFSYQYNADFYENLFKGLPNTNIEDAYKFAAITSKTKQDLINQCYTYNAMRWLQFTLNAIGDPEMSIFTENPIAFNPTVTTVGGNIIVNANTPGCTIAVTSANNGQSYFKVAKNVSSRMFTNVGVPVYITITKHNYIPYITTTTGCNTITNLMNQTIQTPKTVTDCYINVQNVNVNGSATGGTKLILDATIETTIIKDFEVQLGSELEIK